MTSLLIRHETRYAYEKPVAFGDPGQSNLSIHIDVRAADTFPAAV
jgi:hypothetical protein